MDGFCLFKYFLPWFSLLTDTHISTSDDCIHPFIAFLASDFSARPTNPSYFLVRKVFLEYKSDYIITWLHNAGWVNSVLVSIAD